MSHLKYIHNSVWWEVNKLHAKEFGTKHSLKKRKGKKEDLSSICEVMKCSVSIPHKLITHGFNCIAFYGQKQYTRLNVSKNKIFCDLNFYTTRQMETGKVMKQYL